MNNFHEIDFSHAYIAIMTAAEYSDHVTEQELKMLESILLKAKAEREPIKCPHCGSTNCGMSDYEPLAMGENLEMYGQYDSDLYAHFTCFDCREDFRKVLKISHQ